MSARRKRRFVFSARFCCFCCGFCLCPHSDAIPHRSPFTTIKKLINPVKFQSKIYSHFPFSSLASPLQLNEPEPVQFSSGRTTAANSSSHSIPSAS